MVALRGSIGPFRMDVSKEKNLFGLKKVLKCNFYIIYGRFLNLNETNLFANCAKFKLKNISR